MIADKKAQANERAKKWYQGHKEYRRAYNKKYREEHKDQLKKFKKRYRDEHKDQINAHNNKHYAEHKDEINARRRETGNVNTLGREYSRIKCKAKQRGIGFNLSLEKLKEIKLSPCAFAEIDGENCAGIITVDRLTNGAYTDNDVIALCHYHNTMKSNMTPQIVEALYKIYLERGILKRGV